MKLQEILNLKVGDYIRKGDERLCRVVYIDRISEVFLLLERETGRPIKISYADFGVFNYSFYKICDPSKIPRLSKHLREIGNTEDMLREYFVEFK